MSTVLIDLDVPATPELPRKLSLTLGLLTGQLSVFVVVDHHLIASAHGDAAEVAESVALGYVLRIGYTSFKLLPEEVEPVRTFLARFPSADGIPSPSAKLATPVAPDGTCGESPSPVSSRSGGGALDHLEGL